MQQPLFPTHIGLLYLKFLKYFIFGIFKSQIKKQKLSYVMSSEPVNVFSSRYSTHREKKQNKTIKGMQREKKKGHKDKD